MVVVIEVVVEVVVDVVDGAIGDLDDCSAALSRAWCGVPAVNNEPWLSFGTGVAPALGFVAHQISPTVTRNMKPVKARRIQVAHSQLRGSATAGFARSSPTTIPPTGGPKMSKHRHEHPTIP